MESKRTIRTLLIVFLLFFISFGILFYFLHIKPLVQVDIYFHGILNKRVSYRLYDNNKLLVIGVLERSEVENTLSIEEQKDEELLKGFNQHLSDFHMEPIKWWSPLDVYRRWLMPIAFFADICVLDQDEVIKSLEWAEIIVNQPEKTNVQSDDLIVKCRIHHDTATTFFDSTRETANLTGWFIYSDMVQFGRRVGFYSSRSYTIQDLFPRLLILLMLVFLVSWGIYKGIKRLTRK